MKICEVQDQSGKHIGYLFNCPGCQHAHIFDDRWQFNGDMEKPTLKPSYLSYNDNERCHSFIESGRIRFLKDCTHELAGQTVELPDTFSMGT